MNGPLNSPIEVGLRSLMILSEAFPQFYDLDSLIFLDHGLLHSADLGGPPSLHPDLPMRAGEIGAKRVLMEEGLRMMLRAGLVEVKLSTSGVEYGATEDARSFIDLLETDYARALRSRATWVSSELRVDEREHLRAHLQSAMASGLEQLETDAPASDGEV